MKIIKYILDKYFGKLEYQVKIISTDGRSQIHGVYSMKDVDSFVSEINKVTYWDVQKIEKFRRFNFKYDKEVVHSPLWFSDKDDTVEINVDNWNYSFLKKHESLKNVKNVSSKEPRVMKQVDDTLVPTLDDTPLESSNK